MIIDAHVHLPVENGCVSWLDKKERLLNEMKTNGVEQCIVISDSTLVSPIGSLDDCVNLFCDENCVRVVAGISPFYEMQEQLLKINRFLDKRIIVGIKLFTGHEAFYLTDKRLSEIYDIALSYNVPILFHSGWDNIEYSDVDVVAEIAKRYPALKLVCCHCFYPEIKKWREFIDLKNVYFDLSSIADNENIVSKIAEETKKMINAIPTRVLFGSDYSGCSQQEHVDFVKGLKLSRYIEDNVFYMNAKRVYQI